VQIFAFTSPIIRCMGFGFPVMERKQFVVECKLCRREVPAGVVSFPFQSIVADCPLCGERRRYLPSEVFLGKSHGLVSKQTRKVVSNG
jgi:hypothetical protein